MRQIGADEIHLQGAVSVERLKEGIKPWRIPYEQRTLFVPNAINGKPEMAAGVRIVMESDTSRVSIEFVPQEHELAMDCVIDGRLISTVRAAAGDNRITFDALPAGSKRIDIYLSQRRPVCLTGLTIDSDAEYREPDDTSLRWVAYGSSITQSEAAESPAQTWPALVSRRLDWNLTCLGFSGNCHLETMVARMIRDLDADFISMCLGINVMGGSSYSSRTFRAAVIGFVKTIRDRHADIPILVQSPIYARDREINPNQVGFTLPKFREEIREAVELLAQSGDSRLYYLDGLEVMGEAEDAYMPDHLHPNAEGYKVMAERFEYALKRTIPGLFTATIKERTM